MSSSGVSVPCVWSAQCLQQQGLSFHLWGNHGRVFKALPWWILGSTVRQNMFTSSSQSNRSPRMQDQQKLETEITIHLHPLRTKFVVVISLSVLRAFWVILWPCSDLSACLFNVKCLQGNPQFTRSEKVHLYLAWASLQKKRSLFVCLMFTWCIAAVIQMSDLEAHTYNAHISTTCSNSFRLWSSKTG